ncbi:hypothetical protein GGI07_005346 [Coemansia sp. Benny D115]|nr:hypothetical protein GGI07_005346 [Coemansia sp. Benny D115]
MSQLNALARSGLREALANGEPVVALESTIISHGMPYPQNLETAQLVEETVVQNGCTPATIALMNGKIHVGLSSDELQQLAQSGRKAIKTSRRDLAAVLSQRLLGATTVSGTMVCAHMAGIAVFATGGIGGVHRGGEQTMDVSADLTELGRTPVTVVCAGAKSILDLPKTLEYLETQGVPVVAFGRSSEFPAFFSPRSDLHAPWHMREPGEVARLIRTSRDLGLSSGTLVAVPIPEECAADSLAIERAVDQAVAEAAAKGIGGKEATPFLLGRVVELTHGASLRANIALVRNNAGVASRIAKRLASMNKPTSMVDGQIRKRQLHSPASPKLCTDSRRRRLLVIGGVAVDVLAQIADEPQQVADSSSSKRAMPASTSHLGTVHMSVGGVGQNMARAAHLLGADTALLSVIADDANGATVVAALDGIGLRTDHLHRLSPKEHRTAVYCALHGATGHEGGGDLIAGVADMAINAQMSRKLVQTAFERRIPGVVALDGNIPADAMAQAIALAADSRTCVVFEPTSVAKSTRILEALEAARKGNGAQYSTAGSAAVHVVTPNRVELMTLLEAAQLESASLERVPRHLRDTVDVDLVRAAVTLLAVFPLQVVKLGELGVLVVGTAEETARGGAGGRRPFVRHVPALKPRRVVNSNGAGDSLVGALLAGLCRAHEPLLVDTGGVGMLALSAEEVCDIVQRAQRAAILSLECEQAVSDALSPDLLDRDKM